jgi:hypothetical protein
MSSQRRIITETLYELSPGRLDGSLEEAIQYLQELKNDYQDRLVPGSSLRLDWCRDFWYNYDPAPTPMYLLKLDRPESDAEYATRIERESAQQQARELAERAEYERLAKKFKEQ